MNFQRPFLVILGFSVFGSCSPVSPSVHKSTLAPPTPSLQIPDKVGNSASTSLDTSLIESRWLNLEKNLNAALEAASTDPVLRLSASALERLRSEGWIEVEVPEEVTHLPLDKTRVLLRVQLESEDLERALNEETWKFQWSDSLPKKLRIRAALSKKGAVAALLPESLVSVHIVFVGSDHSSQTTTSSQQ